MTKVETLYLHNLEDLIHKQRLEIDSLKSDLERAFDELAHKDKQLEKLEERGSSLTTEIETYMKQMTKINEKNAEYKKTNMELRRKLQEVEASKKGTEIQHTHLSKAQKKFDTELAKKDSKINRLTEEIERLKIQAKPDSSIGMIRSEDSKLTQKLVDENKKLEQQRNELLTGFKKQLKLIDLLKRQITHLESAQM